MERPHATSIRRWPRDRSISRAGEELHLPDDERRAEPGRHVRPQAGAGEVRRPAAARRTRSSSTPAAARSASSRRRSASSGPAARAACLISDYFPARPRARRQAGRHPLVPHRQPRPRLGAGGDEHRQDVHRPAVAGKLGGVRPGHREPEPARLRRDARQARRADQRAAELVERLHAGRVLRARCSAPSATRSSTCAARRTSIARRSATQLDLLAQAQRSEHLDARPGGDELAARIASYELAFRMQAEAPEAVDLSREDAADARRCTASARSRPTSSAATA